MPNFCLVSHLSKFQKNQLQRTCIKLTITFKTFLFSVALSALVLFPLCFFFFFCQNWQIFFVKAQLPRPGDVLRYQLCCFDLSLHGKKVCVCVCSVSVAARETDARYSEHELASLLPVRAERTGAGAGWHIKSEVWFWAIVGIECVTALTSQQPRRHVFPPSESELSVSI